MSAKNPNFLLPHSATSAASSSYPFSSSGASSASEEGYQGDESGAEGLWGGEEKGKEKGKGQARPLPFSEMGRRRDSAGDESTSSLSEREPENDADVGSPEARAAKEELAGWKAEAQLHKEEERERMMGGPAAPSKSKKSDASGYESDEEVEAKGQERHHHHHAKKAQTSSSSATAASSSSSSSSSSEADDEKAEPFFNAVPPSLVHDVAQAALNGKARMKEAQKRHNSAKGQPSQPAAAAAGGAGMMTRGRSKEAHIQRAASRSPSPTPAVGRRAAGGQKTSPQEPLSGTKRKRKT